MKMSKHIVQINGEQYTIPESDIWRKSGCDKDIIKHDGVRRLMVKAGITVEKVEPIVMSLGDSGVRIAFLASGTNSEGRRAFAIGESDPSNLTPNTVAARYPTIMAFKRAIDRLVLDLLELFELYSDVEFSEATSPAKHTPESAGDSPSPTHSNGKDEPSPSQRTDDSGSSGNGNGKGDLPPTDKQISYLWQLGMKSNLTEKEIEELLRMVRTRAGASRLIANMRQTAA